MAGSWRGKHRDRIRSRAMSRTRSRPRCGAWGGPAASGCSVLAANLGEDADTTAAITGQLAGAIYG